jgi:hypothetical protein
LEIRQNEIIVNVIAAYKAIISTNAANGERKPKNKTVQRKLRNSCVPNRTFAPVVCFSLFSATLAAAIPIKAYSIVQTGPKSHGGGLKDGLLSFRYHVDTDEDVRAPPDKPTISQRMIERRLNTMLFMNTPGNEIVQQL